jgi:hypothetical protein
MKKTFILMVSMLIFLVIAGVVSAESLVIKENIGAINYSHNTIDGCEMFVDENCNSETAYYNMTGVGELSVKIENYSFNINDKEFVNKIKSNVPEGYNFSINENICFYIKEEEVETYINYSAIWFLENKIIIINLKEVNDVADGDVFDVLYDSYLNKYPPFDISNYVPNVPEEQEGCETLPEKENCNTTTIYYDSYEEGTMIVKIENYSSVVNSIELTNKILEMKRQGICEDINYFEYNENALFYCEIDDEKNYREIIKWNSDNKIISIESETYISDELLGEILGEYPSDLVLSKFYHTQIEVYLTKEEQEKLYTDGWLTENYFHNKDLFNFSIELKNDGSSIIANETHYNFTGGETGSCINCSNLSGLKENLANEDIFTMEIYVLGPLGEKITRTINIIVDLIPPKLNVNFNNIEKNNVNLVGPNSPVTINYSIVDKNFKVAYVMIVDKEKEYIIFSLRIENNTGSFIWDATQYRLGNSAGDEGEIVLPIKEKEYYKDIEGEYYIIEGILCGYGYNYSEGEPVEIIDDCTSTTALFNYNTFEFIGFDKEDLVYNEYSIFNYSDNQNNEKEILMKNGLVLIKENVEDNKTFEIFFDVYDKADSRNFTEKEFISDLTAPVISSINPINNAVIKEDELFDYLNFSMKDLNGVGKVDVTATRNGNEFTGFVKTVNENNVSLKMNDAYKKGDYIFNVSVYDVLNNKAEYKININSSAKVNFTFEVKGEEDNETITLKDKDNNSIVKFNWNKSLGGVPNYNKFVIKRHESGKGRAEIVISGINLSSQNGTKTVYLDRIANGTGICIKDDEINSSDEISADCKGNNETWMRCPETKNGYSCKLVNNSYEISGLRHSGIKEQLSYCGDGISNGAETCLNCPEDVGVCSPPITPPTGGGGSGGGGGGGGGCLTEWECSEWSNCESNQKTRVCSKKRASCSVNVAKPVEVRTCSNESVINEIETNNNNNIVGTRQKSIFDRVMTQLGKNAFFGLVIIIGLAVIVVFSLLFIELGNKKRL